MNFVVKDALCKSDIFRSKDTVYFVSRGSSQGPQGVFLPHLPFGADDPNRCSCRI